MPTASILYQFFHPDDVVSSVHLTELAQGLVERGWEVTAMPANRSCRDKTARYASHEIYRGVIVDRIRRPGFPQSSSWGRLANCAWMLMAWSIRAFTTRSDVVIIGTDPVMSASIAVLWKLIRPETKSAHWCFDLYPEAALADGLLQPGIAFKILTRIMRAGYQSFDLIADIGICMHKLIAQYKSPAQTITIPPWALSEPTEPVQIDTEERRKIFGETQFAVIYSGNFGRAHSFKELLQIARQMRHTAARFAFSVRGNCSEQLRQAILPNDCNITFAEFAAKDRLERRLGAADVHVVSLRPEWTGTVVPSKFFGALAAGRPVLFIGSSESHVAHLIKRYNLGWVCSAGQESEIAAELIQLTMCPEKLKSLNSHCHSIYQQYFSRSRSVDIFDAELRKVLHGKHRPLNDMAKIPTRAVSAGE